MLEREVKLGAGPAFHLPDLSGVVDGVTVTPPEAVRLETVYYDTADLRLARWGVSLRHRAGEGWTLKLAPTKASGDGSPVLERDELTFQGGAKKPPSAAVAIVRAYVRKAELVPVARLSTWRRRVRLLDATGSRLAEVVDDEVSVRDGRRVAARFREIEVEVTGGNEAAEAILAPVVARLRAAGAGAPDPTPKHMRALGPRAMEPPEVAPTAVKPDSPARDVIRSVLAESVAALLHHDPLMRTSGDPEAVHQARVASRKLRSHLRTFGPLLEPEWTDPLRTELGWLALGLGAVRDREVLLDRLRAGAASLPPNDARSAASLLHILEEDIDELRKKLITELDSTRYIDLLERLVAAAQSPATLPDADQPASTALPPLATSPWRRLRSAVRQLPEQPADPELHRIRILAKRARYAAEAVEPVVGAGAAAFARAAAKLQTILGEHQDSVTAQAWLRSIRVSGRRAFVAGQLIAMEHMAAEEARAKWPKVWKSLDRKRLHQWMP
ncbi:MAG TPA: CYTH and CHAD domain-containing protein [Candidatus Dormibacteraeota bacterium]|nr:CYTH and CHAD domain-containing protein [Candidatus Dormibacteraeota bacterium]